MPSREPRIGEHGTAAWLWVSVVFLMVVAGFVFASPRLVRLAIDRRMFFVILSLLGLFVSFFLFRIMHSTAWLKGKPWGIHAEVTGSAAFFIIFLFVGSHLTQSDPDLSLVIRVADQDGRKMTSGKLTIDLGPDRRGPLSIGENGEVHLSGVPSSFIGRQAFVEIEVPGYHLVGLKPVTIDATGILALKVTKLPVPRWKVAGLVRDQMGHVVGDVRVISPANKVAVETNRDGYFEFDVSVEENTPILLHAEKSGVGKLDANVTPGNIDLDLVLKSDE